MRVRFHFLLAVLTLFNAGLTFAPPNQGSPSQVIGLINSYRAGSGLPAYQENGILMVTAQGQADYLASTQNSSGDIHAGPGGSRPRDRVFAAGYGGGGQIFVSEIAKYGLNETPEGAVGWWKTSQIHNDTMLASTYVEIGCGVATDGNNRYYYVCLTGYIAGGAYTPSSGSSASSQSAQQPAAPVMIPVTKADPQPDGSIMHIIRTGQTLWTLAAVYEVPLQQILDLNGFSESQVVHPNDEVIIAPAGSAPTVAPTQDPNATPVPTASATQAPTTTPTATALAVGADSEPAEAQLAAAPDASSASANATEGNSSVQLVVGIALVSILGVIVASFFIQRPQPDPEPSENDPFAPIT